MVQRPDAILIAGPTASGKSKLALEEARRWGGEIINADSMQIYPVLDILTARPAAEDLAQIPHHLYGFAAIEKPFSVAQWLQLATAKAQDLWNRDVVPVFVGGTGLYFNALEQGLAKIPDIPEDIRNSIRTELIDLGSAAMHQKLAVLDPVGAARLRPGDSHRIARALEVVVATGQTLLHFQQTQKSPAFLAEKDVRRIVLMPSRPTLHERINARAEWMFEHGAIDEVQALLALDLPPEATVLKAIGVRQLRSFFLGECSVNDAKEQVKSATRQYAKRQSTWFRGQFDEKWDFQVPV